MTAGLFHMPHPDAVAAFLDAACVPVDGDHRSGTVERAEAILAAHPDLPAQDLLVAAVLGDAPAVARALDADPAAATRLGGPRRWDPLTHLCFSRYLRDRGRSEGFVRAAAALLDAGASARTGWLETRHRPRPEWESALYGAAAIAGHAALTRLLLARGADPNDEETPYHAPESLDVEVLAALVECGRLTEDNLTVMLLRSADMHFAGGARYLLEQGADPNRMTRWGFTALHQTLRRDNELAMVAAMLEHGADPLLLARGGEGSGVAIAARRGRGDALALFAARGIPLALDGVDRLLAACARDDAVVEDVAAAEPALVEALVADGGTVLATFAGIGNVAGMRRLIGLGVPVDAPDREGDSYFGVAAGGTALHAAAWRARPAAVRLLVERGAAVNRRDGAGRTPLQLAVRACVDSWWSARRTPESVAILLEAGATPEGIALPTGYAAVDALLARP